MPTYVWNRDTNVVSNALTDQSTAQYSGARGASDIRLIITRGGITNVVEEMLDSAVPSAYIVGFVLRDPANLDTSGYLAGPTVLTRGASAADGYIGSTSTDTETVREMQGVGQAGVNQSAVTASAVFYYVPVGGGAPVESQPFPWTITPAYYQTGLPPATIVEAWPSAAQLIEAIAAASAAVLPNSAPTFAALTVSGVAEFHGAVSFPPGEQILQDGDAVALCILATDADSHLAPVAPGNGQSIRLKADGTGWEPYTPNTGNGSGLTGLTPGNLSGPVPIAKGGTGAATATAALTALGAEAAANKGSSNGYCPLDSTGKVGSVYLPSYVDDVIEVANLAALPGTGESGKIYVTLDTNFEYRWSGSTYIQLVSSPGTTDALVEGTTNLYFTPSRAVTAVGGTLHTVTYGTGLGGPSGNGTTIAYSSSVTNVAVTGNKISDNSGQIAFTTTSNLQVGDVVATITFQNSYGGGIGPSVLVVQSALAGSATQTHYPVAFGGVMATGGGSFQIVVGASWYIASGLSCAIPSGERVIVSYIISKS